MNEFLFPQIPETDPDAVVGLSDEELAAVFVRQFGKLPEDMSHEEVAAALEMLSGGEQHAT